MGLGLLLLDDRSGSGSGLGGSSGRRLTTFSLGLAGELLDELLEGGRAGSREARALLGVLEGEEGGDGADSQFEGEVGDLVGVEAGEGEGVARVVSGELVEDGGDGLAGAAPGGVGLDGDVGGLADQFVELGLGLDVDDG
ncbi:unnamed protein product [Clonostachys chloroleuca]|uniref:Uncharacterized protein n=1 Tax=Clonostachys chloroleuca TaxID=1926264 RepID=A0AA35MA51_9HYPO|nr:unnamed protein product [Clonostachys chloroleuca]